MIDSVVSVQPFKTIIIFKFVVRAFNYTGICIVYTINFVIDLYVSLPTPYSATDTNVVLNVFLVTSEVTKACKQAKAIIITSEHNKDRMLTQLN